MADGFHLTPEEVESWSTTATQARIRPDLQNSALIVIDLQAYFTHPDAPAFLPASRPVIGRLIPLIEQYIENDLPVIFTRHVDIDDDDNLLLQWWQGKIEEGERWSLLDTQLLPYESSGKTIVKHHYDSFRHTDLERYLKECEVNQVVIAGVMTHLCCETTARSAFMRGFPVIFLVDGTASAGNSFHESTLTNLQHGFATPMAVDDVRKNLAR